MENNNNRLPAFLPLVLAALLLLGIFIGTLIPHGAHYKRNNTEARDADKIREVIQYIQDNYVDTVNPTLLYDAATSGLLGSLDPHSIYISAAEFHEVTDPLNGNFEGIGIQFRIRQDTLVVIRVIPGGPSEKAGLAAGDRIVGIDGKPVAKTGMTDEEVIKRLKGPKDSKVGLDIFRKSEHRRFQATVTRGVIPTYSVDASFIVRASYRMPQLKEPQLKEPQLKEPQLSDRLIIGYLKLSRFSATTVEETEQAIKDLEDKGMTSLILDLRDNSGGFLEAAIALAEQFLPEKTRIVYTQGRKKPRQDYFSGGKGLFLKGDLVILIDEGSASASEILAGAVQDNDRGTIIGRRSYGKGLVQEEIDFKDGSAIRLTVARYYTPTGRCIQRPYSKDKEEYSLEPFHRFFNGEMEHPDSIPFADSLKFITPKGKIVYGGGGIMPDIYVKSENNPSRIFVNKLINNDIIYWYAFDYTDQHRKELSLFTTPEAFDKSFRVSDAMMKQLTEEARRKGITFTEGPFTGSSLLRDVTKSMIARFLFDDRGFYPIYNRTDDIVQKALEFLSVSEKKR